MKGMRVFTYILSTALLAGLVAAQTAPASQTVKPNPQQPAKSTSAKSTKTAVKPAVKPAVKSPFVPKTKITAASPSATKKEANRPLQAQNGNQPKTSQTKTAAKPNQASAIQAKVQPKTANASVAKKQEPKKQESKQQEAKKLENRKLETKKLEAKKPEAKKPETKTAPVQAKTEAKPVEPEKKAVPAPATPVAVQSEPVKLPSPGKRDPFLSPLVAAGIRGPANCTTGKRCLVVDQIVLKGVVQMKNGNLALVENAGRHPYVLHENDSLFNGTVVKITGDSLILREESSDILGRPVSREVVKKVTAPSV